MKLPVPIVYNVKTVSQYQKVIEKQKWKGNQYAEYIRSLASDVSTGETQIVRIVTTNRRDRFLGSHLGISC